MIKVIYDRQLVKSDVVEFLEVPENWDNVVKLLGWENRIFTAHELYDTLSDLYLEGIKGAEINTVLAEGQEVEYLSISEYVTAWMDGDF